MYSLISNMVFEILKNTIHFTLYFYTTKGHVTSGDMINLHKKVLGKLAFQRLSRASNPADIISWTFCRSIIYTYTITLCQNRSDMDEQNYYDQQAVRKRRKRNR